MMWDSLEQLITKSKTLLNNCGLLLLHKLHVQHGSCKYYLLNQIVCQLKDDTTSSLKIRYEVILEEG